MPRVKAIPEKSSRLVRSQNACSGGPDVIGWAVGTVDNVGFGASLSRGLTGESSPAGPCALAGSEIIKKQPKMIMVIMNAFAEYRIAPSLGIPTL